MPSRYTSSQPLSRAGRIGIAIEAGHITITITTDEVRSFTQKFDPGVVGSEQIKHLLQLAGSILHLHLTQEEAKK